MKGIEIESLGKNYCLADGKNEAVFQEFNLSVHSGQVVGLWGPNGCGKTTLLNTVAGLLQPDAGMVRINGKPPADSKISYIFQDYRAGLFPWLSARSNITYPLRLRKESKANIEQKLELATGLLRPQFDLGKYPYQLSGGQQQIVAIMRGMIVEPEVLLIDEPFSALDTRNCRLLLAVLEKTLPVFSIPVLIVAHTPEYLTRLAHRFLLLSARPTRILRDITVPRNEPDPLLSKSDFDVQQKHGAETARMATMLKECPQAYEELHG